MKRILLYGLILLCMVACDKEELTQQLTYENLYVIEDNPADPVVHRIYELYRKYNVPIYFNDTVGQYFVRNDIHGGPVYRDEILNLNWNFFSDNSQDVKYTLRYQQNPERQMRSLDRLESYLERISAPLQPYVFLIVDTAFVDRKNMLPDTLIYSLRFRLTMLAMLSEMDDSQWESVKTELIKSTVSLKMANYSREMDAFYAVGKREWLNQSWKDLNITFETILPISMFDEKIKQYLINDGWTEEQVEEQRQKNREKIGQYGFVGGNSGLMNAESPESNERDFDLFLSEAISVSREEFIRRWGKCPLVMKKYEILAGVISTKLGYEL